MNSAREALAELVAACDAWDTRDDGSSDRFARAYCAARAALAPDAATPTAWICTHSSGRVRHFGAADGWRLDIVSESSDDLSMPHAGRIVPTITTADTAPAAAPASALVDLIARLREPHPTPYKILGEAADALERLARERDAARDGLLRQTKLNTEMIERAERVERERDEARNALRLLGWQTGTENVDGTDVPVIVPVPKAAP